MLLSLLGTVAEISLATSVLIIALLLLSPLLRKHFSAKCLLIACLILSARLLIPYNIRFPEPVLQLPVISQTQYSNVPPAYDNTGNTGSTGLVQAPPAPAHQTPNEPSDFEAAHPGRNDLMITTEKIIAIIWVSGAAVFLLIHAAGYILLRKSVRRYAQPANDGALQALFEQILEQMNLSSQRIILMTTPKIKSPLMTGFSKPVVLLPSDMRYSSVELEMILRHELVHYKRKDIWAKLLVTCANAVHWYNPLVYILSSHINKLIETACDSEIIKNTDMAQRRKYGESILNAIMNDHGSQLGLSTYFHGGKNIMKQRLVNIFDGTVKKRGIPVILAVILAVGLSGTLVSCKANVEVGSDGTTSPAATDTAAIDTSSDTTPTTSPTPDVSANVKELAETWAEAVKNRDGKAQYALMSKALQEKVYDEFNDLNWVTGTSSPWVESYQVENVDSTGGALATAVVTLNYATSTGPAGSYQQTLTFVEEDGTLKINAISELVEVEDSTGTSSEADVPSFDKLIKLLGLTKDELLAAIPETPEPVDEGGLGFTKAGIRVWFDAETYTKVAQVLIMTDKIDINGVKVGGSFDDFKTVFGEPVSDNNGDAHFKYGEIYLSVVRDTSDKVIAVYILAEDF